MMERHNVVPPDPECFEKNLHKNIDLVVIFLFPIDALGFFEVDLI